MFASFHNQTPLLTMPQSVKREYHFFYEHFFYQKNQKKETVNKHTETL